MRESGKIQNQLRDLEKQVEKLLGVVDQLEERLQPVMPANGKDPEGSNSRRETQSLMGETIEGISNKLMSVYYRIVRILDNLEL